MSFLSRIDGALAQISIAVADGDAERTVADAHQLRGSALNLGLVRVGAAAEAIEELARTGDLTGADELLATCAKPSPRASRRWRGRSRLSTAARPILGTDPRHPCGRRDRTAHRLRGHRT